MSSILDEICDKKRQHVAKLKTEMSEADLREQFPKVTPPRGFRDALKVTVDQGGTGLIAEIKKASPSKGLIRKDFDPLVLAEKYETGGATCLSVLTDEPYFQGKNADLMHARAGVKLPVLRKDFIVDPYQVIESRAIGADCILLIMAALSDVQAKELYSAAKELHLDVLVEVHSLPEMERTLSYLSPEMIGINNRNLKTMEVDLSIGESLVYGVPSTCIPICESGIRNHDDLTRMKQSRFNCFLVGESLMLQSDVTAATRKLLKG